MSTSVSLGPKCLTLILPLFPSRSTRRLEETIAKRKRREEKENIDRLAEKNSDVRPESLVIFKPLVLVL